MPFRFAEILRTARSSDASDVHAAAGAVPIFRIDGCLEVRMRRTLSEAEIHDALTLCFEENYLSTLRERGDYTRTYTDKELGTLRMHAYVTRGGVALAIRLLALEIPQLAALRLPDAAARLAFQQHGLVLVTGPTGSGKSTMLAAAIDEINRTMAKHIITIEDPMEYRHRSQRSVVSQREVDSDVASFDAAVAGALRSDPDVIMLGEMRSRSTMQAAINAAETGHLVLATMHTGGAPDCIERIVGAFEGTAQAEIRAQLAETLAGVVSLRLVTRAGGRGRLAAAEVMLANDAVRSAVREAKPHHLRNIIATGRQAGMQTLEASLNDLIVGGEITADAARAVSAHPDELRLACATS